MGSAMLMSLCVCVVMMATAVTAAMDTKEPHAASTRLPSNYTVTDEAWFEVEVKDMDGPDKHYRGRFTVALFGDTCPMTVLNFKSLVRGYKRGKKSLHYRGSAVHRLVPDFVLQMGDVTRIDGTGGESIYGKTFIDENFTLSHRSPGYVSMANHGRDTNGSQFFVILNKARWLDGKHVVFGKVVRGMDVVNTLAEVPTDNRVSRPLKKIWIVDCGINDMERKYVIPDDMLDSIEDL